MPVPPSTMGILTWPQPGTTNNFESIHDWAKCDRELSKKPTQIVFTRSGQTIVVADKFGDVFSYPLTPAPATTPAPAPPAEADALVSHENPSGGTLILGHTSLLTAFLLTPDETHIITVDRDEHIRASWFPQGYMIESFCLGHKKFVSAIHIPRDPAAHDILVSGGGDPVLKVWEWRAGRRLYNVVIEEAVHPFIAVRRARRQRGYDSDGERKPPTRRWLARQRRRQAKAAALVEDADTTPDREGAEVEIDIEDGGDESEDETAEVEVDTTPATPSGEHEEPPPTPVLVVQKIETLTVGSRLVLAFSAVGATALFWFALPPDPAAVPEELLVVHAHDFGRPVVTFAPVDGSTDCIWVSLDAHWTDEGPSPGVTPHVRLVRLTLDSANELSPPPPLLSTLNGASVIPANEREISALQLYESLTSLPKNIDATHNPMIRDAPDSDAAKAQGNRSAKAAGKMRTRMALLERGIPDEPPVKKTKGEGTEENDDVMDES
ncbi:hypothetical protein BJV78DRAFT_1285811 [Lactifluus subvellereus]|nr:hypothetical protein BJV78DRAFT_1285811 [Lactifluus subvellereus]